MFSSRRTRKDVINLVNSTIVFWKLIETIRYRVRFYAKKKKKMDWRRQQMTIRETYGRGGSQLALCSGERRWKTEVRVTPAISTSLQKTHSIDRKNDLEIDYGSSIVLSPAPPRTVRNWRVIKRAFSVRTERFDSNISVTSLRRVTRTDGNTIQPYVLSESVGERNIILLL